VYFIIPMELADTILGFRTGFTPKQRSQFFFFIFQSVFDCSTRQTPFTFPSVTATQLSQRTYACLSVIITSDKRPSISTLSYINAFYIYVRHCYTIKSKDLCMSVSHYHIRQTTFIFLSVNTISYINAFYIYVRNWNTFRRTPFF